MPVAELLGNPMHHQFPHRRRSVHQRDDAMRLSWKEVIWIVVLGCRGRLDMVSEFSSHSRAGIAICHAMHHKAPSLVERVVHNIGIRVGPAFGNHRWHNFSLLTAFTAGWNVAVSTPRWTR